MRVLSDVGLEVLIAIGSVSLIWNMVLIFICKTISLRWEYRIYSISALLKVDVLGNQLTH
jgi:hypothetical protein